MIVLEDILQAKERRWQGLNEMIAKHQKTVLSVSLNTPGQEKDSVRLRRLFQEALDRIGKYFSIEECVVTYGITGPHALFSVYEEPAEAKSVAYALEEEATYSRLWDIDVYDKEGKVLSHQSRSLGRKCLICETPSIVCMREKNHTASQLADKVDDLFIDFYVEKSSNITEQARIVSSFALEAVLYEITCSPSPGLVCPKSKGSHTDMDFFTFLRSSSAVSHYLAMFAQAALQHEGAAHELLPVLRKIGIECEKSMFAATGGINTQKGLIFSMGLVLGASGLVLKERQPVNAENICEYVKMIAKDIVKEDMLCKDKLTEEKTAGEEAFAEHSIEGVRGEAEAGFPSVVETGLPVLREMQEASDDVNKNLVTTLFALMQVVDDTTVLKRGKDKKSLGWVKKIAEKRMEDRFFEKEKWYIEAEKVNRLFVKRGLSPGGSADLLALCWYLYSVEKYFNK